MTNNTAPCGLFAALFGFVAMLFCAPLPPLALITCGLTAGAVSVLWFSMATNRR